MCLEWEFVASNVVCIPCSGPKFQWCLLLQLWCSWLYSVVESCYSQKGTVGDAGARGPDGKKGDMGLTGVTGPRGHSGHDGLPGQPGVPGHPGKPVSATAFSFGSSYLVTVCWWPLKSLNIKLIFPFQGKPPSDEHLMTICSNVLRSKYPGWNIWAVLLFDYRWKKLKIVSKTRVAMLKIGCRTSLRSTLLKLTYARYDSVSIWSLGWYYNLVFIIMIYISKDSETLTPVALRVSSTTTSTLHKWSLEE